MKLWVDSLQVLLYLPIGFLEATEALSIVRDDAFHHFTHAPVSICFYFEQSLLRYSVYLHAIFLGLPGDRQVLIQKNDHKRNHNIAHSLHIAALRMAHVPDEQYPFQPGLDSFIFTYLVILTPYPPYISLDGFVNLFLLLVEFLHAPIVID